MRILVTGGAGFIGSAIVRQYIDETDHTIINLDKLTYAANLKAVASAETSPRYRFEKVDICNREEVSRVFREHEPDAVMHLAAESHVDRSIDLPDAFISTNVLGTQILLDAALDYWQSLDGARKAAFRFLHVSTDEVFGSLGKDGVFTETTPYDPRSPYAASKAASDHLVRAWHATYGLPAMLSHSSNNYGPYQFPEKLIPLMISKAKAGEPLPVYGAGEHIRDWLYVEDHARGLRLVLEKGQVGEGYNIGAQNEQRNLGLVERICDLMDELQPRDKGSHRQLITFVDDRPGHDFRYAIDASKIRRELGWRPQETFESALRKTAEWYLANPGWSDAHGHGYRGERLGLGL